MTEKNKARFGVIGWPEVLSYIVVILIIAYLALLFNEEGPLFLIS